MFLLVWLVICHVFSQLEYGVIYMFLVLILGAKCAYVLFKTFFVSLLQGSSSLDGWCR